MWTKEAVKSRDSDERLLRCGEACNLCPSKEGTGKLVISDSSSGEKHVKDFKNLLLTTM